MSNQVNRVLNQQGHAEENAHTRLLDEVARAAVDKASVRRALEAAEAELTASGRTIDKFAAEVERLRAKLQEAEQRIGLTACVALGALVGCALLAWRLWS